MTPTPRDLLMVDNLLPVQRSLRVAVVTETYPPEVNGVAATVSRVVDGLLQRGHELQLVRPRQDRTDSPNDSDTDGGRFAEVLMRGLPIPRYPQLKMGLPSRRALVRLWTARRPDLVHLVTEGPLGWSALQAAAQLKLPVVSDFRTNFHAYSKHYGVGWMRAPIMAYLRKFHNRCACTMVPTDALRRELEASRFQRVQVVSRGVDTQRFDPARRSDALRAAWGARPDTLVAMCVGRIAPEKNLQAVLDAAAAMREAEPAMRLVLVGDGPDKARLEQTHPEVVFAGLRRGDDLAAHYASADVFLFASQTETFGNVVMEAMASGLAVVAYDQAAAGELIRHGHNGLLAPSGDGALFSHLARQLGGDLPRARALGLEARTTARRMDWGRIVDAVEAAYAQAMAQPWPQPRVAWAGVMPAA
ncbi:Glycoside hydrolase [Rubrivivax sp. A210]|uniref:glycosyltransferase family 4 protein n=1 Tax=Rubrivivax sp. A210 TaxID=2772301 RepID=UPI0019192C55|nr:glycosyltransferase family 1 protein [Rubrivivax sp. A210]CAD5371377.1 Glycoside hydrolase [Rubrivivax sp. A210]